MNAPNESAAGWSPAALQSTSQAANEPHPYTAPEAPQTTPILSAGTGQPRPIIRVVRVSGAALRLSGQPAFVVLALQAAGDCGLSAPDVQPPCWHLASAIRDLRLVFGDDAISTLRGDRRQRLPARYRLVERLSVHLEGGDS